MAMKLSCNLKIISWIVAFLYALFGIFGAMLSITVMAVSKTEEDWKMIAENKTWAIVILSLILIYALIVVAASIGLMVGLKKRRVDLIQGFVNTVYGGILLAVVITIKSLFRAIRKKKPAGEIALDVLYSLLFCAFLGLLLFPVYVLLKNIKKENYEDQQSRAYGYADSYMTQQQQQPIGYGAPYVAQQQTQGNEAYLTSQQQQQQQVATPTMAEQQPMIRNYPTQNAY